MLQRCKPIFVLVLFVLLHTTMLCMPHKPGVHSTSNDIVPVRLDNKSCADMLMQCVQVDVVHKPANNLDIFVHVYVHVHLQNLP